MFVNIILIILATIFSFYVAFTMVDWDIYSKSIEDSSLKLSFKDFKAMYSVNPARYMFNPDCIIVRLDDGTQEKIQMKSYRDHLKYCRFSDSVDNNFHNMVKFLNTVQGDVDKVKTESAEMVKSAVETTSEIVMRM